MKNYKAVLYEVKTHHEAVEDNEEPWLNSPEYDTCEMRFCIVSTETGEVLDDAQGYGYKTAKKAYSAYGYKTRDKSKDKEKEKKEQEIRMWIKTHHDFRGCMDGYVLDILKGSGDPHERLDARLVRKVLNICEIEAPYLPSELLKVYCTYF